MNKLAITETERNTRRIAKNTILLYGRMLFAMAVALYTSREVLSVLGVEDFGIYNVVGGIVVVMGFLNSAMTASTQRFMSFAIGKSNQNDLNAVFSSSINVHLLIALLVLVLAETVGLWFLKEKLVIPPERETAAFWVYQMSIVTFVANILNVPYSAAIIAHENMRIYAVLSIIETVMKLVCVLLLPVFLYDKLIVYSVLLALVSIIIRVLYTIYCKSNYIECNYKWIWNGKLMKEMGSFANWNLLGVMAGVGYNQGVNILLNLFFGPSVNAARGIAFQVQGAVNNFVTNLQLAVTPPITKAYARNEKDYMYTLIFRATRFTFYLLLLICLPLITEMDFVLSLWLRDIPDFSIVFCKLILVDILVNSLSGSLQALAQATGRIKLYQIVVSGILLLNLPISYFFLLRGFNANFTFFTSIVLSLLALLGRLWVLNKTESFPLKEFFSKVLLQVILVLLMCIIVIVCLNTYVTNNPFISMLLIGILSFSIIVLFGSTKSEKVMIINKINQKIIR